VNEGLKLVLALSAFCLLGTLSSEAPAVGTCGTGGVLGTRIAVEFEGSLYYVTTPDGYTDGQPWPLILGLHGDEGDPANSVNYRWRDVVDDRFIFVAPKAANESGSWYEAQESNEQWMDQLLASLYTLYNIDLDRISIWGVSGGAVFISSFALRRQDLFAAAQWNKGGSRRRIESPETCKLPARFSVAETDFLHDNALSLYQDLTDSGHETEWAGADCEGHCWDPIQAGPAARDWLLDHTLCGVTPTSGCMGDPPATGGAGGITGSAGSSSGGSVPDASGGATSVPPDGTAGASGSRDSTGLSPEQAPAADANGCACRVAGGRTGSSRIGFAFLSLACFFFWRKARRQAPATDQTSSRF
jgi:predicted esterase